MILTQVLPQPVPVRLAGADYLARQLRLRDVAKLQQWIASSTPCPAAEYRPIWEVLDGEDRQKIAARAYLAAEKWPPEIATPEGDAALYRKFDDGRRHGIEALLMVVLDGNPGFSADDARSIAEEMSVVEFAELTAIAYGIDILDELASIIDLPPDPHRPDEPINWGKVAWEVMESVGIGFEAFGDLYLGQFRILRTHGEHARGQIPMRPGMDIIEEGKRRRRLFYGDESEAG